MSSDQSSSRDSPPPPASSQRRRSSFVDMFQPRTSLSSPTQNVRRLSITTLGLSTLPNNQTSPFNAMRHRAESVSSANSGSVDESPFEEDSPPASIPNMSASVPATPFARRMSFGAARAIGGNARNSSAGQSGTNSNEGFDFAENIRARAERGSLSSLMMSPTSTQQSPPQHHRSKSVAAMEPAKTEPPKQPARPDAFQERILKGDFYMD